MKKSLDQFLLQVNVQKCSVGRRLSHFSPEFPHEIGNVSLRYDYKREKLETTIHSSATLPLYLQSGGKRSSKFFFLNSGQAGIFLILLWLKNIKSINHLHSPGKAYVGFHEGTKLLNLEVTYGKSSGERVAWICSSTFNQNTDPSALEAEIIIIDSTCWSLESEELSLLIRQNPEALIFVIRSHSKLDMGGVEFGSLGSVLVLSPESKDKDLSPLTQDLELIIKLSGLAPSLDDIPPFLFDAEFMSLNEDRITTIKKETNRIREAISELQVPHLSYPAHGTYFFLTFPAHTTLKRQNIIIQALFQFLKAKSTDFKRIPSFGFNFLAITPYIDISTSELVIRFAPSLEPVENDKLITSLKEMRELGLLTVPSKKV